MKPRYSIAAIAILTLVIDALFIRSISLLAPLIRTSLNLDVRQIGYVNAALVAGTLVITLPLGSILGRVNTRQVFPIIMASVGLVAFWIAVQNSFEGLLIAMFMLGLLRAGIIPSVTRVITENFPQEQRGRIMGLVYAAYPLGGFIGAIGIPALAEFFGWHTSYRLLGVISLVGSLLLWRLTPKDSPNQPTSLPKGGFSLLKASPFIVLITAYAIFEFSMAGEVFVTLYLVDVVKISAILAGTFFGIIQLTGMGGRVFLGFLADRYFRSNRWGLLAITSGLMVISYGLLIRLGPASPWWIITGIMVLLGMSVASSWGVLSALLGDVVAIEQVAIASATIFFITNISDVLGSVAYGNFLNWTQSYQTTLGIFMGFGVISVFIFAWMAYQNRHHTLINKGD
jgi:YNFM family putative membrane transporter